MNTSVPSPIRVAAIVALVALAAMSATLLMPAMASAHPLGNFTINHYNGIRVGRDAVLVDHVADHAEIPTFSERRQMDTDGDGSVSASEAAGYESRQCADVAGLLHLTAGGQALPLTLVQSGLSFPAGQGGLTMRLVCVYRAEAGTAFGPTTSFSFEDRSHAERQGWREIVVQGDGMTLTASDAPVRGTSQRLTAYPADLLAAPMGQSSALFSAQPGGPALPAFSVADARRLGQPYLEAPADTPAAVVPGGVTDLGAEVTALFQARELTPDVLLLSLVVAAALGALHALSPGHGKAVMAAYLVGSRGSLRHAAGLGLTVTVSHTLGVLALGALSLSAAQFVPPERLYPLLGITSGAIVILIGAYLLLTRLRTWRADTREHRDGHADHHRGHTDDQHAAGQSPRPSGWHEHDGVGHTHLPPAEPRPGSSLGWRGLFALGLSGGLVPSVSALILLLGSVSLGRPAYGIVLTVAFGLGMAVVLVGIGMALVYARGLIDRLSVRRGSLGIGQRLPVLTAAVVLAAGVLITGQALLSLG
jgi:ABC-type nickel/cobalt efflux system permease component RcnA